VHVLLDCVVPLRHPKTNALPLQGQWGVEGRNNAHRDLHCTARMSYDGQLAEVEELWFNKQAKTTPLQFTPRGEQWYYTCFQPIVGSRGHNSVSVFTMQYPNILSEKGTC
jgi:hypothetical protein